MLRLLVALVIAVVPAVAVWLPAADGDEWRRGQRQTVASGAISVYDGDTFYVGADAFRLRGIDTPELGQPRGVAARERLRALLRCGAVVIVPRGRDIYGRIVVDVYVDARSVARILRAEGYAKPRPRGRAPPPPVPPDRRQPSAEVAGRCPDPWTFPGRRATWDVRARC
jgi:endonuclease YncB( thermonuclease family)